LESLLVNIVHALYGKKGESATSIPLDFMPKWRKENVIEKKQSPEEIKDAFLALAKQFSKKPKKIVSTKLTITNPLKRKRNG
jgi:hypothetical protein